MKTFKTYAFIQSLNKGKMQSTELDEVEILEEEFYKYGFKTGVLLGIECNNI